jgi:glycogen operon protein
VTRLADRLLGSLDVYRHKEREAEQSINFITCHDGFTLNDLISYNHKHNEDNGENSRDGADDNRSWNCGVEGPSDDFAVNKLRNREAWHRWIDTPLDSPHDIVEWQQRHL